MRSLVRICRYLWRFRRQSPIIKSQKLDDGSRNHRFGRCLWFVLDDVVSTPPLIPTARRFPSIRRRQRFRYTSRAPPAFASVNPPTLSGRHAAHAVDTLGAGAGAAGRRRRHVAGGVSIMSSRRAPDERLLALERVCAKPAYLRVAPDNDAVAGAFGDAVDRSSAAAEIVQALQTEVQDVYWISTLKEPAELDQARNNLYRDVPMGGLQIAACRQARLHPRPSLQIGAAVPDSALHCCSACSQGLAFTTPLTSLLNLRRRRGEGRRRLLGRCRLARSSSRSRAYSASHEDWAARSRARALAASAACSMHCTLHFLFTADLPLSSLPFTALLCRRGVRLLLCL